MNPAALTDEETLPEASGSQSDRKTSISINTFDVLSVNQLLESVRSLLEFSNSCLDWPIDQEKHKTINFSYNQIEFID